MVFPFQSEFFGQRQESNEENTEIILICGFLVCLSGKLLAFVVKPISSIWLHKGSMFFPLARRTHIFPIIFYSEEMRANT